MKDSPYERWRANARMLLRRGIPPERAQWNVHGLFGASEAADFAVRDAAPEVVTRDAPTGVAVPRRVIDLLERAACHRDPGAPARMYRVLWRVLHGERNLLDDAADDDVVALTSMAKAVDRASHKMTAFVRFREVRIAGEARYIAWFEPEHDVLARTAPFFVKRFATMIWTIATRDGAAHWDRRSLALLDVDSSAVLPHEDAAETLWLTYYESIFNPARLNLALMRKEMPTAYWKNLPEAARIPALVHDATARAGRMVAHVSEREVSPYRGMRCAAATAEVHEPEGREACYPDAPTRAMLDRCRHCELGTAATQAVPGEGPRDARLMLVGEQPGDEEDLAGAAFVGPAGRLLRQMMTEAGVDPRRVWITNAVKHFRFEPRGKRRIHKTPAQRHIEACRPWVEAEIAAIAPRVVVALGATALRSLLGAGSALSVADARSLELLHASGARIMATYHPAAVLRARDAASARTVRAALVDDLRTAAALAFARGTPTRMEAVASSQPR